MSSRNKQAGATLVEVLVAVLILSFGLLGMAALQTRAVKGNVSSVQRSQAVMLSHYILDVMRVDRESAKGGLYNTGSDFSCDPSAFSTASLPQATLNGWLSALKANVGRPTDTTTCARVTCDANYLCTIQIRWDDSAVGGLSEEQLTISISSRV